MNTLTKNHSDALKLLLDSSREAFLLLDSQDTITGVSRPMAGILAWKREELVGKPFYDLFPPGQNKLPEGELKPGEHHLNAVTGKGELMSARWNIVQSGSPAVRIMLFMEHLYGPADSELATFEKAMRDLIDAERKNSLLEEAFRGMILDDLPVGVMVADSEGRIVLYNRAQEVITGIGREQALGGRLFKDYASQAPPGGCRGVR